MVMNVEIGELVLFLGHSQILATSSFLLVKNDVGELSEEADLAVNKLVIKLIFSLIIQVFCGCSV